MTPLDVTLHAFADRRLADWAGLPANASIDEARQLFGLSAESEGRGRLGSEGVSVDRVSLSGRPLTFWYRDSALLLLEDEGSLETLDLVQALGPPPNRLDVPWSVVTIPEGEWVYPARGLSAIVSSEGRPVRLFGFAPVSLDEYERTLRPRLGARPLPYSARTVGGGRP